VSRPKPKIAVIDDNEVVLEVTRGVLEGAGYEVVTHDRSAGCVALLLHEKPDLLLMDVNMPGLGGDTIVSVLGKAAPSSETVVLLYSGLPPEVLKAKASAAGAHGFVHKSSDSFALVREVNRWLKRLNSSGHMRVAAPSSDERSSSGTVRVEAPIVLLVDDDMSVLSAFRRTLQTEDVAIAFALSGGEALRRLQSDKPPAVVVCDMVLPDISGAQVYERALALEPSYRQRFIVATGAANLPTVAQFLSSFSGPVLHKPVAPAKLTAAVRSCLSGARRFVKTGARPA
jgi:CheY-like chemotaxis protein